MRVMRFLNKGSPSAFFYLAALIVCGLLVYFLLNLWPSSSSHVAALENELIRLKRLLAEKDAILTAYSDEAAKLVSLRGIVSVIALV